METDDAILIDRSGGIKTITMNTPHKRNALSAPNALRMAREIEQSAEDGTRVIVLTGTGGAFCAGADLAGYPGGLPSQTASMESEFDEMITGTYHRLARAVHDVPRPVVAAVDGVAAGFGCSLALTADITLASTAARFIQVFVNIALIPDGGASFVLPRLVGMRKALEMALTGDPVSADEALRLNMINGVYPSDELRQRSRDLAERLARGPVNTMGVAKQTFHEAQSLPYDDVLDMESRRQARLMTKPDFLNAVMAFLQKKTPTFS